MDFNKALSASFILLVMAMLACGAPTEVYHQVSGAVEERAIHIRESSTHPVMVSLSGAAGFSLKSKSILSK